MELEERIEQLERRVVALDTARKQATQNYHEYLELNEAMNRLAIYIRNNYAQEIARGDHTNLRTAVDVAIRYMSLERAATTGLLPIKGDE